MRLLSLICILITSSAAAQDLVYSNRGTEACMQAGRSHLDCIGISAERCMEDTPGGFSTVGMGGCLNAELKFWDRLLNVNYKARMAQAKQADLDNAGFGPSQADALRQMQRAWIPFRDAKCDFERSQWGGGSGGGPATIGCLMNTTAEQAVFLGQSWGQ